MRKIHLSVRIGFYLLVCGILVMFAMLGIILPMLESSTFFTVMPDLDPHYEFIIYIVIGVFAAMTGFLFVISNIKTSHNMPIYKLVIDLYDIHYLIAFYGLSLIYIYITKEYCPSPATLIISIILGCYSVYTALMNIISTISLTVNAGKYYIALIPYMRSQLKVINDKMEHEDKERSVIRNDMLEYKHINLSILFRKGKYRSPYRCIAERDFQVDAKTIGRQLILLGKKTKKECEKNDLVIRPVSIPGQYCHSGVEILAIYSENDYKISRKMKRTIEHFAKKICSKVIYSYDDEYQYITSQYYYVLQKQAKYSAIIGYRVILKQLIKIHTVNKMPYTKRIFIENLCEILESAIRAENMPMITETSNMIIRKMISESIREGDYLTQETIIDHIVRIIIKNANNIKVKLILENKLKISFLEILLVMRTIDRFTIQQKHRIIGVMINALCVFMKDTIVNNNQYDNIYRALQTMLWAHADAVIDVFHEEMVRGAILLIAQILREGDIGRDYEKQISNMTQVLKLVENKDGFIGKKYLVTAEKAYAIVNQNFETEWTVTIDFGLIRKEENLYKDPICTYEYIILAIQGMIDKNLIQNQVIKGKYDDISYCFDKEKYQQLVHRYSPSFGADMVSQHMDDLRRNYDANRQDKEIDKKIEKERILKDIIKGIYSQRTKHSNAIDIIESRDIKDENERELLLRESAGSVEYKKVEVKLKIYRPKAVFLSWTHDYANSVAELLLKQMVDELLVYAQGNGKVTNFSDLKNTDIIVGYVCEGERKNITKQKGKLVQRIDEEGSVKLGILEGKIGIKGKKNISVSFCDVNSKEAQTEITAEVSLYERLYGYIDINDLERLRGLVEKVVIQLTIYIQKDNLRTIFTSPSVST